MACKTLKVVLVACNLLRMMKMMQRVFLMLMEDSPPMRPKVV